MEFRWIFAHFARNCDNQGKKGQLWQPNKELNRENRNMVFHGVELAKANNP